MLTNATSLGLTAIMLAVLVILGLLEMWVHRRVLARLPIRIHVNGTRGKTSVVRLIAAGLRAGDIRVCSKTTGSFAAVTGPNGEDYPLFRPAQPNIIEQMRVLRRLLQFEPEAVVIECMALQPQYQFLSERKMVRATHGVITNARPDHLDIMGPAPHDVALALAGTVPFGGCLFTAESKYLDVFQNAADERGSTVRRVTAKETGSVTEDELAQFGYAEHAENVALALAVCADLGVDRSVALAGMQALTPEVGATQIQDIAFHGRDLVFVNGFAANDPESTEMIWERMVERYGEGRRLIALINCRADRPQRSEQLADVAARWSPADHYIVMGSGTLLFARRAIRDGIPPDRMTVLEGLDTAELFERVLERGGEHCLIVGMCNVHGGGEDLARYFNNRAHRSRPL